MAGATIEHAYQYAAASSASKQQGGTFLSVATSGRVGNHQSHPYFFQGRLVRPRACALALRVLAGLVGSRFYIHPASKDAKARLSDPIVTCGGGLLRFEGFSSCCGAYGRVDFTEAMLEGVVMEQGTTNVDFNAPMRAALSQIRDNEQVGFAVGSDEVTLLRGTEQVIERKVALPTRWIKGLIETQAFQSRMKLAFVVQKNEALLFIKALPKSTSPRAKAWVGLSGRVLRVMQIAAREAIPVSGIERLRVIEELLPFLVGLRVYSDPIEGASAWEIDLGGFGFTLVLSPEVWRGFSGEGQALQQLSEGADVDLVERVRASLKWQAELRAAEFAQNWEVKAADIERALSRLAALGLVGFDLQRQAYFHRELPFDMAQVEDLHPRLVAARKIVTEQKAKILSRGSEEAEVEVAGTGVMHRVRLMENEKRCSCPWFSKNQGSRGPCKHILAADILVNGDSNDG